MPHNQLGTLAGSRYYSVDAAYHYLRWYVESSVNKLRLDLHVSYRWLCDTMIMFISSMPIRCTRKSWKRWNY